MGPYGTHGGRHGPPKQFQSRPTVMLRLTWPYGLFKTTLNRHKVALLYWGEISPGKSSPRLPYFGIIECGRSVYAIDPFLSLLAPPHRPTRRARGRRWRGFDFENLPRLPLITTRILKHSLCIIYLILSRIWWILNFTPVQDFDHGDLLKKGYP